jgi:hypothetical protein
MVISRVMWCLWLNITCGEVSKIGIWKHCLVGDSKYERFTRIRLKAPCRVDRAFKDLQCFQSNHSVNQWNCLIIVISLNWLSRSHSGRQIDKWYFDSAAHRNRSAISQWWNLGFWSHENIKQCCFALLLTAVCKLPLPIAVVLHSTLPNSRSQKSAIFNNIRDFRQSAIVTVERPLSALSRRFWCTFLH